MEILDTMADSNFVYLTRERLFELEKEMQEMKNNGRKEMARKIAEARAHGDLSENAEYDAAKEEQGLFELRISKLENVLSRVRIIDGSHLPEGEVHILSKVKIKNIKIVGGYAIQILWLDGHNTGIYSWEYLKDLEKGQSKNSPQNYNELL